MTWSIDTGVKTSRPRMPAAGLVFAALLVLGAFAEPADAQGRGNDGRGNPGRGNQGRDKHHNWNGGYYRPPPIVYGSPYRERYYGSPYYEAPRYYPPPVVYGPGLHFNFQIR